MSSVISCFVVLEAAVSPGWIKTQRTSEKEGAWPALPTLWFRREVQPPVSGHSPADGQCTLAAGAPNSQSGPFLPPPTAPHCWPSPGVVLQSVWEHWKLAFGKFRD